MGRPGCQRLSRNAADAPGIIRFVDRTALVWGVVGFRRVPAFLPNAAAVTNWGISRGTLRRVLERLEAKGKIWRHVGRGTFVGQTPPGN